MNTKEILQKLQAVFQPKVEETQLSEIEVQLDEVQEEVVEQVEQLTEQVEQAIVQADAGIDLPENIQKVVDFMNDTGGSLEDYVKLNTDYSALNEAQLIKEYYETTKPHLDKEDIELLMEDFSYDEELDEPKEIRKAKIAFKEEAAKANVGIDNTMLNAVIKELTKVKEDKVENVEDEEATEFK